MHAALHDDVGFLLRGQARQLQGIADNIRHAMENFWRLIIMRQDHRIALLFDFVDRLHIRRKEGPFDRGDHILHTLIKMSGGALDFGCPFEDRLRQDAKPISGAQPHRPRGALRKAGHRSPGKRGGHDHGALLMLIMSISLDRKITEESFGVLHARH